MTPDKATALREAAEMATPGPWQQNGKSIRSYAAGHWAVATTDACRRRTANAAYIALADPPTILALLAERERLRGALRACIDRIEKPNLSPDANYVVERARQALETTHDQ